LCHFTCFTHVFAHLHLGSSVCFCSSGPDFVLALRCGRSPVAWVRAGALLVFFCFISNGGLVLPGSSCLLNHSRKSLDNNDNIAVMIGFPRHLPFLFQSTKRMHLPPSDSFFCQCFQLSPSSKFVSLGKMGSKTQGFKVQSMTPL
jgi:hypothetical protein